MSEGQGSGPPPTAGSQLTCCLIFRVRSLLQSVAIVSVSILGFGPKNEAYPHSNSSRSQCNLLQPRLNLALHPFKFRGGSTRSHYPVRVQYELLRSAFIEGVVASRCILQGQHCDIHRLRDSHLVVQDGHHELPVVTEHGTLPRTETVGFSPAKTNPQTQHALLGIGVLGSRIVSDLQSG